MHLLITQSTILKPAPEQARSLPPSSLAPVNKGKVLPVLAYAAEGDHLRFTLDKARINLAELHGSGRNTWYVYGPHCEDPSGYGLVLNVNYFGRFASIILAGFCHQPRLVV